MFFVSCAHRGQHPPDISSDAFKDSSKCGIPFVTGNHRFIHSVEGRLPEGRYVSMIGITLVSPAAGSLHCVMMTLEGFVIFDAVDDNGKLTIHRGIPPFDSEAFAKGVMADIRLIFFKPVGMPIQSGMLKDGDYVCRYMNRDSLTDLILREDQWEIRRYEKNRLIRVVKTHMSKSLSNPSIPDRLELNAYDDRPYSLKLNLIQSEPF